MANLRVYPDRLVVELSSAEQALALRRGDLEIARASIRSATITHDPWVWLRGVRSPGSAIPGVLAFGVWRYHGGRDFVVVKGRRAAVVLELEPASPEEFTRLILSTPHSAELAASLKLAAASDGTSPRAGRNGSVRAGEQQGDAETD